MKQNWTERNQKMNWLRSAMLTLGIILMIPSIANASDRDPAAEIRRGALTEAKGDTSMAFFGLSVKTAKLLDKTNILQGDLDDCGKIVVRYQNIDNENRSWLRRAADSDIAKVGILIGGILLGASIANN